MLHVQLPHYGKTWPNTRILSSGTALHQLKSPNPALTVCNPDYVLRKLDSAMMPNGPGSIGSDVGLRSSPKPYYSLPWEFCWELKHWCSQWHWHTTRIRDLWWFDCHCTSGLSQSGLIHPGRVCPQNLPNPPPVQGHARGSGGPCCADCDEGEDFLSTSGHFRCHDYTSLHVNINTWQAQSPQNPNKNLFFFVFWLFFNKWKLKT